jgi:hypothetical protein
MVSSRFQPKVVSYLPDKRPTVVYVSSFTDAVYSLLSDPEVTNEDSLSFSDPEDPFVSHPKDPRLRTNEVSELHHGKWHPASHEKYCTGPNDVLVPIIGYMDGVSTDANGCLGLIPFNFTLGIFNVATQTKKETWVTLYYHPDDEAEAALHVQPTTPFDKVQNIHQGLDDAFAELRQIMAGDGLQWDNLRYGGKVHIVNFKFVFTLIIGGTEMHDKLCGRYQSRVNVNCLCCHCDCPLVDTINPLFQANLFTLAKFERELSRNNIDYFKSISHHPIINAFHKLDFGANIYNIHLASPGEVLHMYQKGMNCRLC